MTDRRHLNQIIPEKVIKRLGNSSCSKCNHKLGRGDVIGIGIRQNSENHHMFLESNCPQCSTRLITKFNNDSNQSIEDMCCLLLREIQNRKNLERAQKIQSNSTTKMPSTPISEEEFNECVEALKSFKTHEDFLEFIRVKRASND